MLISEGRKTFILSLEKEKCKACYYCVQACPQGLLRASNHLNKLGVHYVEVIAEKANRCTACKSCAIMCPDTAISIHSGHSLETE